MIERTLSRVAPGIPPGRAEVRRNERATRTLDGLAVPIEVHGPIPSDGERQTPRRLAEILV